MVYNLIINANESISLGDREMNVIIETKYRVMWTDDKGNKGDVGYPREDMDLEQAQKIAKAYERAGERNIRYDIYEVNYQIPVVHS